MEDLTGVRRTARDFRHSVAQRLADSGASMEEVAHFLGHSPYRNQPRLFRALRSAGRPSQPGSSHLSRVCTPGRGGANPDHRQETAARPASRQPSGRGAHGTPVAGIGGCDLGQSLCQMNPPCPATPAASSSPSQTWNCTARCWPASGRSHVLLRRVAGGQTVSGLHATPDHLTAIQKVIEDLRERHRRTVMTVTTDMQANPWYRDWISEARKLAGGGTPLGHRPSSRRNVRLRGGVEHERRLRCPGHSRGVAE